MKSIGDLQRDCAAAIKSIKFDKQTGRISEIVLADKVAAASVLLRSIGISETTVTAIAGAATGLAPQITDEDRIRALANLLPRQKVEADSAQAPGEVDGQILLSRHQARSEQR